MPNPSSVLASPPTCSKDAAAPSSGPAVLPPLVLALHVLLLAAAVILFALHGVHLLADFPNHSPWKDWSKYTDEGWYGDAAIRHFQLGHWYVPGDFNPAAALPVWPLVEALVFRFTGVSPVAARALTVAVFGGICVASWLLLHRWRPVALRGPSLAASSAVLLLAASPFVFVFTRMAILEPSLILLTLLALLAASAARFPTPLPPAGDAGLLRQRRMLADALRVNLLPALALTLLLPAIILTKTTGLFLVPAIAFLLFARLQFCPATFLRVGLPAALLGVSLWLGYYLLLVRNHLLLDYRYLFSANAYTGITRTNFVSVLTDTATDGAWMGPVLYPLGVAAGVFAVVCFVVRPKLFRLYPLITALLLWIAGYVFFLAYHDNLQPRYYLVVAVPLTLLLPAVFEQLVLPLVSRTALRRALLLAAAAGMLGIAGPDAHRTVSYLRHPQYTLLQAARDVAAYIAADRRTDPAHNPLLLSISGSDISLMTGVPSICDDFGTLELPDRVQKYRPGWYAAWNDVEDDKMEAMAPLYRLERVAQFPAMDDPDRNLLILYKLVPAEAVPQSEHRPKSTPRSLRTKVGQQPSVTQLEH